MAVVIVLVAVPGPSPGAMQPVGHVAAAGAGARQSDVAVAPGMPGDCGTFSARDEIACGIAQRFRADPGRPRLEILRDCDIAAEACSHSNHYVVVVNY
jgi:hypothetical protein